MTLLALNLADRSFDSLVEAARSRLPALAPGWTDYNLHDPGITLIELLAWLSEAQIYSLARMRRDERAAYAQLLGVRLAGPQPAGGIIWPDPGDRTTPSVSGTRPLALTPLAMIRPSDSEGPEFHAMHPILLVPGRTRSVSSRLRSGMLLDHTSTNARGAVAFEPFGPEAGARDVLRIEYECVNENGLAERAAGVAGAHLSVGVRVDGEVPASDPTFDTSIPLEATLISAGERIVLEVAADTTRGWLRTGCLMLALSPRMPAAQRFALELRAPSGFLRPPRVRHVALNAVPVLQYRSIKRETHSGTGLPDQTITLEQPGLRTDGGLGHPSIPPIVEVQQRGSLASWKAIGDLAEAGPEDPVHRLDAGRARVHFGNGVNGKMPERGAQILVSYSVCEGAAGNQPRPRAWFGEGLGALGRSLDAFAGGIDAVDLRAARGLARRNARNDRPLVAAADVVAAALRLTELEVARAWVPPPPAGAESGTLLLIAMRRPPAAGRVIDEPQRWLNAIRRALQPGMPLGTRLVVRAPRYIDFSLDATLVAERCLTPADIERAALTELRGRLALHAAQSDGRQRELGSAVSARDIGAWLRRVDGVARVTTVTLRDAAGRVVDRVAAGRFDLPRLDPARIHITVARSGGQIQATAS